jgi:hypothetical protein
MIHSIHNIELNNSVCQDDDDNNDGDDDNDNMTTRMTFCIFAILEDHDALFINLIDNKKQIYHHNKKLTVSFSRF